MTQVLDLRDSSNLSRAAVIELQAEVAHMIASASEAGGLPWLAIRPIVDELGGGAPADAPAVVAARIAGTVFRRQIRELDGALAVGDDTAVRVLRDALGTLRDRLAAMLAAPAPPGGFARQAGSAAAPAGRGTLLGSR